MKQEEILYEDDWLIAVNKPSGLLSIPDRIGKEVSLKIILQNTGRKIFTVHRIDRDTSGVIVFAKDEETHKALNQCFEQRETIKIYQGLVTGAPASPQGSIDAPIAEDHKVPGKMMVHARGKQSLTDYQVLESFNGYTWMQFRIHTGRTHQVRVHAAFLGHSLVCDALYGNPQHLLLSSIKRKFKLGKYVDTEQPLLQRLPLHASALSFQIREKNYQFVAPLPKDIRATLQQLKKWCT